MPRLVSNLRSEIQALTFSLRRKAKYRLHTVANDTLERVFQPRRFEENFSEQWQRILERSGPVLEQMPRPGAPKILFGTMFGQDWPSRPVEATIAMALRLRGATPIVLACDHGLPACEWNAFGNHEPDPGAWGPGLWRHGKQHACDACVVKLDESHALPGLERLSLSDFGEPGDVARAMALVEAVSLSELRGAVHRDVSVGEHAYAALLRATLRGTPVDDERTRWMARRFLASCIVLVERGERVLQHVQPDRFVAADGVYVLAGTLCELARKRGVHVVVHGTPYRKGTTWLSHHDCYHRLMISNKDEDWTRLEMTPDRKGAAEDYLASKHFVARDYITYHVDSIQDEAAIRRELGLDERPIITLFTNILWDSQLYYRFKVFPDMLEWLYETIRFYEGRRDLQLVIRLHPGEARGAWPTNQPLLAELKRVFPVLPENVKVVEPESKVSSYALGSMSRVALIYGARMGVELVMLGVPVIVAGEAFMRGKGFSYDPATSEEYIELLARGADLERPSAELRERAKQWYYHYFFRLMMPFPFYAEEQVEGGVRRRLTFDTLDALLPGRSPVLDLVCRGIMDGTTRFEWDEYESSH
jgi:hypothetical protein